MKRYLSLLFFLFSISCFAQNNFRGGEYIHHAGECVPQSEYTRIHQMLSENIQMLRAKGLLAQNARNTLEYSWPLRQADGFSYNEIYGISNFVDHNEEYSSSDTPSTITDYNCQSRSYDTGDGYNHAGTDYFTWPFGWKMMADKHAEIIAIADGTIIGKDDGNHDENCTFNGDTWNALYVLHEDNSVSWYGHMKKNSLTTKDIGESVVAGEYLGVIGSSGNSTGPHLHLEIYKNGNLIDPYSGTCNPTIIESCWEEEKPYREPSINTILTHNADPNFLDCPSPTQSIENHNIQNCFLAGQAVYFAAYYHDQIAGLLAQYRVIMPNGTIFQNWQHASPETYNASYWYWWWTLPSNAMSGIWTFEVKFGGETVTHEFSVGNVLATSISGPITPEPLTSITYSTSNQNGFTYEWTIENGTILDGQGTSEVMVEWEDLSEGEICVTNINATDCISTASCLMVDIIAVHINEAKILNSLEIAPNPNNGQFTIILEWGRTAENINIQLLNTAGQEVQEIFSGDILEGRQGFFVNWPLAAGVYLLIIQGLEIIETQKIVVP